jgi:hypothetical protein
MEYVMRRFVSRVFTPSFFSRCCSSNNGIEKFYANNELHIKEFKTRLAAIGNSNEYVIQSLVDDLFKAYIDASVALYDHIPREDPVLFDAYNKSQDQLNSAFERTDFQNAFAEQVTLIKGINKNKEIIEPKLINYALELAELISAHLPLRRPTRFNETYPFH